MDREADKPASTSVELEDFKHWLGISMSSQAEIPAQLPIHGSAGLAEMIEAVHKALLACLVGLEDCNERTRCHWRQTQASRRSGHLEEPDRVRTVLQRETESWGKKIRWLQELGLCLEHERARSEALLIGDSESRRAYV